MVAIYVYVCNCAGVDVEERKTKRDIVGDVE